MIAHTLISKILIYLMQVDNQEFELQVQDNEIVQLLPEERPQELMDYINQYILLQEEEAILNCEDKTIRFMYNGIVYEIDLTQGDLGDSWGTISEGDAPYDTNFSWDWDGGEEYDSPSLALYPLIKTGEGENFSHSADMDNLISIKIKAVIGTPYDYFD